MTYSIVSIIPVRSKNSLLEVSRSGMLMKNRATVDARDMATSWNCGSDMKSMFTSKEEGTRD